jgi:ribose/xylose/arabinose/galactoside ABC-type transport system permease subunit
VTATTANRSIDPATVGRFVREKNIAVILVAAVIILAILEPRFLSIENLSAISRQVVPVGFIALGQFFVITSANIDLSLGYASTLWAIVLGVLWGVGYGIWVGLLVVFVGSIIFGAASGTLVAKLKLPAFIVTLGGLFIARGLGGLVIPRQQIFLIDDFFAWVGGQQYFGFYAVFLIMLAFYAAAWIVYNRTAIGGYVLGIGNSEENTRLAGVNVDLVKIGVFAFAGFCAGLAGIVIAPKMGFVQPGIDGNGLLLDAIAAIVIGGANINGGRGTVTGTLMGVLFIGVLNNSMSLLNIEDVWQLVYKGVVILAALVINWLLWESHTDESR